MSKPETIAIFSVSNINKLRRETVLRFESRQAGVHRGGLGDPQPEVSREYLPSAPMRQSRELNRRGFLAKFFELSSTKGDEKI
jgi:hypothetical protein